MEEKFIIFGNQIRKKRESYNISLRQLAKDIEISPTYLSQIEQGKFAPPAEDKICALAQKLKLDEDELQFLALADKVPSEFKIIFTKHHSPLTEFLRTAKSFTKSDWVVLNTKAKKLRG